MQAGFCDSRICSREGDENIAGAVARCGSGSGESHGCPAREALELLRKQRGIRGGHDDDGPDIFANAGLIRRDIPIADFAADGNARDRQLIAASTVALHEHSDGIRARFSRRGADAAFEPVADHSGSTADCAFGDSPGAGSIKRGGNVFRLHVESVDVIQKSVEGFRNYWQIPQIESRAALQVPLDIRVSHDAYAVRVGDHHGAVEESGFFDPGGSGHLAVAILRIPSGECGIGERLSAGENDRDAGANIGSLNQRCVADLNSGDVRDGVQRAGCSIERNAEIARSRLCLSQEREGDRKQCESHVNSSMVRVRGSPRRLCEARMRHS